MGPSRDDLPRLMPFTRDKQDIIPAKLGDGSGDSFAAVRDVAGVRGGAHDFLPYHGRVLAARVIVGDVNSFGALLRDGPHSRALAPVAVAATAEYNRDLAPGKRPQRAQGGVQRIRRMRIVDENSAARGCVTSELHPAPRAMKPLKRWKNGLRRTASGEREPGGDRGIRHLKRSGKRQL